ncbi:MAG TPA: glutathione peroxidase [Candidatus Limnocylindrales bacterium]|nr:glutathione peroxidase [Candidatus Limnocylindrales bacterium]
MNRNLPALLLLCALGPACSGVSDGDSTPTADAAMSNLHSIRVASLDGVPSDLSQYKGQVLLVVNTASECGYTPQYEGLEKLYEGRKAKGLAVLGFPSNDFGGQEPGDAAQIKTFCTQKYGVTFPMFSKVVTKSGPDQSPVYAYLGSATGKLPAWNFAKYLVGKDGKPIAFYDSKVTPENPELLAAIDAALAAR